MKAKIKGKLYDTDKAFFVHGAAYEIGKDLKEEIIHMNYEGEFFIEKSRIFNVKEDGSGDRLEERLKPISKNAALKKLKILGFGQKNINSLGRLVCFN